MKRVSSWIHGLGVSLLIVMFCIDLPLEVLFQILWHNGYESAGFWIENLWKMLLIPIFVLSFVLGHPDAKKEQLKYFK